MKLNLRITSFSTNSIEFRSICHWLVLFFKMLDRFLLIRPAPLTCFVSICKRYVRTAPPTNPPTPTPTELSSTTIKEEKTAVDSTGKVFTFKHGYVSIWSNLAHDYF